MENADLIKRLTEREKECLRLWLRHKTAKEIALDLGVSHHAVEKRLKMARTKLGVATSLQAARLLAQTKEYDPFVPQTPDLPAKPSVTHHLNSQLIIIGGLMIVLALGLAMALVHAYPSDGSTPITGQDNSIKLSGDSTTVFDHLDADKSGYLEMPESPVVTLAFLKSVDAEKFEGKATLADSTDTKQVDAFYAAADKDGDGRVSYREYQDWVTARLSKMGIEISRELRVKPAPKS